MVFAKEVTGAGAFVWGERWPLAAGRRVTIRRPAQRFAVSKANVRPESKKNSFATNAI